jgi:hypothetical protein
MMKPRSLPLVLIQCFRQNFLSFIDRDSTYTDYLIFGGLAGEDRYPLSRGVEEFGQQPDQLFVGLAIYRRRGEPELQNAVQFARDAAFRRARLNAHGESHASLFCRQFDQYQKKTAITAFAASESTNQRITNEKPASAPPNSKILSSGLMRLIDQ